MFLKSVLLNEAITTRQTEYICLEVNSIRPAETYLFATITQRIICPIYLKPSEIDKENCDGKIQEEKKNPEPRKRNCLQ